MYGSRLTLIRMPQSCFAENPDRKSALYPRFADYER
jgi:hypothetical protein